VKKLGKILFLFQAFESVHEEHAKYPKKIVYAYTTPHLAVEALEVSYQTGVVLNSFTPKLNNESFQYCTLDHPKV